MRGRCAHALGRSMAVLVVEDEIYIRMEIVDSLRDHGFSVVEACNADEALHFLLSMDFDAVFSDITMPGSMDGVGLAKWVRQHKPSVKVVLTSGKPQPPAVTDAFGAVMYKPYSYRGIVERIRAAVHADEPTTV